ncbi:glutaredoxin family protein [Litchfieldella xinjiangensis]|uniref:glutaredoxin family protein n=1 Tax=Litchfieldella xinjiangensis TaxID=1166948 RepID=UPI0005BAAA1E|nr:glutaredoxin family protein [Halomonas xinjiangensis]
MIRLSLYTTLGCHLCDALEHHLARLCATSYALEKVEIAEDDALAERYGMRIPVLVDEHGAELDRGFDAERLAAWLAERGWLREPEESPTATARAPTGAVMRGGRRYLG